MLVDPLGLLPGSPVRVTAALFTQGINEEQSVANLMGTHTAEQELQKVKDTSLLETEARLKDSEEKALELRRAVRRRLVRKED